MASNSFGKVFKITTWGESHGKAIGVVIDGCPAGLEIEEAEINHELAFRAPGKNPLTSPRKECDCAEILSGVFEGKTTGTPICIMIPNRDVNSSPYEATKQFLRPGHANYTYLEKYGVFDYRGSGRASARETACRVAAGAIAKKILKKMDIELFACIKQIGASQAHFENQNELKKKSRESPVFCPCSKASQEMITLLEIAKSQGDSLGGVVEFYTSEIPVGLGDPVYEKLEANLALAMMSLPATKGFEMGSGFEGVKMPGSKHNDLFILDQEKIRTKTNHAGGTLGGISTGMPLIGRVAFKPTSSIQNAQATLSLAKEEATLKLPEGSRHDPCVAIRAVPVVEAMLALVLVDALLMNRCVRLT